MEQRFFSEERRRREPTELAREQVPERVRNAIEHQLSPIDYILQAHLWRWCVHRLDWSGAELSSSWSNAEYEDSRNLSRKIRSCDWIDLLDLTSAVYYYFRDVRAYIPSQSFRNSVNESLLRHHSAYFMEESGLIVEAGSALGSKALDEARALLAAPELSGPDRQFQSAIEAFQRRPNPNYEDTVSAAVGALEGLLQHVHNTPKMLLTTGLRKVGQDKALHSALVEELVKVGAYASDDGGRHAWGPDGVSREVAEYCLHRCAAAIVLIAKLYGFSVVESR